MGDGSIGTNEKIELPMKPAEILRYIKAHRMRLLVL